MRILHRIGRLKRFLKFGQGDGQGVRQWTGRIEAMDECGLPAQEFPEQTGDVLDPGTGFSGVAVRDRKI